MAEKAHVPSKTRPKARPNHFFAVRIQDVQILEAVQQVQKTIVEREPRLKTALVSPSTLHITLAVAHLSGTQDLERANQVLEESVKLFTSSGLACPRLDIQLAQVGHFNNRVVYAGVMDEQERLTSLWRYLRDGLQTAGIPLIDGDRFTPHVTLVKLSKDPSLHRKGIKVVASHLYQSHVECVFGRQVIESVELLSMTDPKDEFGYYALKGEFHFVDARRCAATPAERDDDVGGTAVD